MSDYEKTDHRYKSESAETPYQRAAQEWDSRIGNARTQAFSWRLIALCLMAASLFLILIIAVLASKSENYVYVAEVDKTGAVVNVQSLDKSYSPSDAEYHYFIRHFVESITTVSLDPVLMRKQWKDAYSFVAGKGVTELNTWAKTSNPFTQIGKTTKTTAVSDIVNLSKNSYQVRWVTTSYDQQGKVVATESQEGVFTVQLLSPKTQQAIFINPLGIRIVDFRLETVGDKS